MPPPEPRSLVVVGAAAGMGRWLTEHLFGGREWDQAVIVDTAEMVRHLDQVGVGLDGRPFVRAVVRGGADGPELVGADDRRPVELPRRDVVVCLAVPRDAVAGVSRWLGPALDPASTQLCAVAAAQGSMLAEVAAHLPGFATYGLHPLFDGSARSLDGQTVLVVQSASREPGPDAEDDGTAWLRRLIDERGGSSFLQDTTEHDDTMAYVQTLTHQVLVSFVKAVVDSGLDLERLWAARTPLFESLFSLAVRAISERQQSTVADIQLSTGGTAVAAELQAAQDQLREAIGSGDVAAVEALIESTRDGFSGALFETVQATAVSAVTASQSKRAELARRRRLGELVGVRPIGRPDALRVGRIADVTPVSVTLRETMVGRKGEATLLDGPGRRNAGRVGMSGTPQETTFGLGHIDLVIGDELERALDDWLAHIRRDVRFLVPESVDGVGVRHIVSSHPGIRGTELRDEVVRTGQRSVVLRVLIRADHDVDDMVEALRSMVQDSYVWPDGLSLSAPAVTHVHYLGPPGTFSEPAARQARSSVAATDAELVPCDNFDDVLASIGPGAIGVLPISSSASGLVGRAVRALLRCPQPLVAGGVVDVAVRIDAYIPEEAQLGDLRGATVHSHPQALGQCGAFIRRWDLHAVPSSSTTEALRIVAEDGGAVALAGASATPPPGLKVAEREVDDLSGSITRFLILGTDDTFGDLVGGSVPTLRSLVVGASLTDLLSHLDAGEPAFDEILTSGEGLCLWVTSRDLDPTVHAAPGLRLLGRAPWSPRTPVVRVEVAVTSD